MASNFDPFIDYAVRPICPGQHPYFGNRTLTARRCAAKTTRTAGAAKLRVSCSKGVESSATGRMRACPKGMATRPSLRHVCRTWGSTGMSRVRRTLCGVRLSRKASLRAYCHAKAGYTAPNTLLCHSKPSTAVPFPYTGWSVCLHPLPDPYLPGKSCSFGGTVAAFPWTGAGADLRHCAKVYPAMETRGDKTCNQAPLDFVEHRFGIQRTSLPCKRHLNPLLDFSGFCHTSGDYLRVVIGVPRANALYTFTLSTEVARICNTEAMIPTAYFQYRVDTCWHDSVETSGEVTPACPSRLEVPVYDASEPHHTCLSVESNDELSLRCKTMPLTNIEPPRWGRTKSGVSRIGFTKVSGRTGG